MARKRHKIKKLADIDAVEFGDQLDIHEYVKYPEPPQTDKDISSFDERWSKARKREDNAMNRANETLKKKRRARRKENIGADKNKAAK